MIMGPVGQKSIMPHGCSTEIAPPPLTAEPTMFFTEFLTNSVFSMTNPPCDAAMMDSAPPCGVRVVRALAAGQRHCLTPRQGIGGVCLPTTHAACGTGGARIQQPGAAASS
jgi:hypothetical protein